MMHRAKTLQDCLISIFSKCCIFFYFSGCVSLNIPPLTWGVTTAGVTGAADAVLQPGAVGEGVSLVWRPGR